MTEADKVRKRDFTLETRTEIELEDYQLNRGRVKAHTVERAEVVRNLNSELILPEIQEAENSDYHQSFCSIVNVANLLESRNDLVDALLNYTRPEV